ncbi:MAG: VOC family protein, partial [Clostridia bacterium]|nr:VOC family protein [Clostridia bacterium]
HLALAVDALEEVLRTLTDAGYAPEPIRRDTFTGERMTFVKDPDGLPIELHE